MTDLTCKFCNKNFSTTYNLNKHIATAKICISKRENNDVNIIQFPCKYCNKIFTQNSHMKIHLDSCKSYIEDLDRQKIEKVEQKYNKKYTKKITKITNELEKEKDTVMELEILIEKANDRIREIELKNKELELKLARKDGQIDILKTIKPVINNTINNGHTITYINPKLANIPTEGLPYLTADYIQNLVEDKYTYDYFIEGPSGIAKFFSDCVTIPNEDNNDDTPRLIFPCTDGSRHKYHKYENTGWKLDAGASFLSVAISALKTIANEHFQTLTDKCANETDVLALQLLDDKRVNLITPMMLGINSKSGKRRDKLVGEVRGYLRPLVSI